VNFTTGNQNFERKQDAKVAAFIVSLSKDFWIGSTGGSAVIAESDWLEAVFARAL